MGNHGCSARDSAGSFPGRYVSGALRTFGGFQEMGVPLKWLVYKGNLIKIDDLGVPPFMETAIWCSLLGCQIAGMGVDYPIFRQPHLYTLGKSNAK